VPGGEVSESPAIEDIVSALDNEEDELLVFFKDTHKPERGID